jgi:hypothetical protein
MMKLQTLAALAAVILTAAVYREGLEVADRK